LTTAARWLKENFDYEFEDAALLECALTHRSADGTNNERLEFLGDAVLDFVVSDMVYTRYPDAREGELSRLRASLVRDSTLADIATSLGLGDHLILGAGELKSGGFRRASILADALEAIFGAIYVDSGFEAADATIRRLLNDRADCLPAVEELKDPKTRLQERLQADGYSLPCYETEAVSGKAHKQVFDVVCSVPALQRQTRGRGRSRRDAEQDAAMRMLAELSVDPNAR
jgi:ribonuclease-3